MLALLSLPPFCARIEAQTFKEMSSQFGINAYCVDEHMMGGGVAFFDYNQDLYPDIFIVGGERNNALYRNNWDGTFSNVSKLAGVELHGRHTYGIAVGDIDNDGDEDIFLTTGIEEPNILLENKGDGTFQDISREAGITETAWSTSASLGDVNLDGWVDVYVTNYAEFISSPFAANIDRCSPNFLYKNLGNRQFVNIASEMGLADVGCGLAVALTDCDNDHDVDVHVANDFGGTFELNELYLNAYPEQTFQRSPSDAGIQVGINGMGIAIGDYDEDGDWDYYVTNMGDNPFFENIGKGYFEDVAHELGTANADGTSWGAAFGDVQNDTYLDLIVANGEVVAGTHQTHENRLFLGNDQHSFMDISELAGLANPANCRGLSMADYDKDGDLDLMFGVVGVGHTAAHTLLYQNLQEDENHWLTIKLQGIQSHRNGYGSRIRAVIGARSLIREVDGGSSYLSHSSSEVHIGLGTAPKIDSLIITWPGGHQEVHVEIAANQHIIVEQGGDWMPYVYQKQSIQKGDSLFLGNAFQTEAGIYRQIEQRTDGSGPMLLITKLELEDSFNEEMGIFDQAFSIAPNPFHTGPQLLYSLSEDSQVSCDVFDMNGRHVHTIFDAYHTKGPHTFRIEQLPLVPGFYLFRLKVNDQTFVAKAVKVD